MYNLQNYYVFKYGGHVSKALSVSAEAIGDARLIASLEIVQVYEIFWILNKANGEK